MNIKGIKTPELDKQAEIIKSGQNEVLGNFYDWLNEQGYEICGQNTYAYWDDDKWEYQPIHTRPEQLFADFFGIDLDRIEQERRAILEALQQTD